MVSFFVLYRGRLHTTKWYFVLLYFTPLCSHKHHFAALNNANRRETEFTKRLTQSKDRELAALTIPKPLAQAPPTSKLKRRGEVEFRSPSAVLKKHETTTRRAVTPVSNNKLLLEEESDDDTVIETEDVPNGATTAELEEAVLDPDFLDTILPNTGEFSLRCSDIDALPLFQDEMVQTRAEKNGDKPELEMVTITKAKHDKLQERIKTLRDQRVNANKRAGANGRSLQAAYKEIDKLRDVLGKLEHVPQAAKKEIQKLAEDNGKLKASVEAYIKVNAAFTEGERRLTEERDELCEKCQKLNKQKGKLHPASSF